MGTEPQATVLVGFGGSHIREGLGNEEPCRCIGTGRVAQERMFVRASVGFSRILVSHIRVQVAGTSGPLG